MINLSIYHWQTLFDVYHLEMNVLTHKTFYRYLKILAYIKSGLIFEDHVTVNFKLIFRWLVILSAHFIVESDKSNNATWKTHNINNSFDRYLFQWLRQSEPKHKHVWTCSGLAVYGKIATENMIDIFNIAEAYILSSLN